MDRCGKALELRRQGYNCAQSVTGAFTDLTGLTLEQVMAASGGFGGGLGGSHKELCGAVSGAVLALSLLYPQTDGADAAAKKRLYQKTQAFYSRFQEVFGLTHCQDLLAARPGVSDKTPASRRLGVTAHCDNMVVTAVELVEEILAQEA